MISSLRTYLVTLKNSNPWLLLLWLELLHQRGKRELEKYSDEKSVEKLYFDFAGRWPNLVRPRLFSEKQQWLKLNYRDQLMPRCADKWEVRKFIEEKGYVDLLNDVIAVYDDIADFKLEELPDRFVLKATHGSGWNLVCKDKNKINWMPWRFVMKSWLKSNIFWNGREWPYKEMKSRILCEKYLEDESGQLMDYKFFCFNGEPKFIQANKGRGTKQHAQNFYDLDWCLLPFGKDLKPIPGIEISKPACFQRMINIVKDLSAHFSFVRIDLYEVENRVLFGEFTFFPASGMPDFTPAEYDAFVGDMWILPKCNLQIIKR